MTGAVARTVVGFPELGRTRVMGVVNVTPDSFSDGGEWASTSAAVAHGLELVACGADLIDVGGESTRPGAARVSPAEELRRVLPVVQALAAAGVPVSVDTSRAEVARASIEAGALLINDVSAGQDPLMLPLVAATGIACVVMHGRGASVDMQSRAVYGDVVTEVLAELEQRLRLARDQGVSAGQLLVDPGLGFAKTAEHNWQLMGALPALSTLAPVLVGASRKAFLGALLLEGDKPRPAKERDAATAALTVVAAQAGAWAVRVHEVSASADAVRVVTALRHASERAAR